MARRTTTMRDVRHFTVLVVKVLVQLARALLPVNGTGSLRQRRSRVDDDSS